MTQPSQNLPQKINDHSEIQSQVTIESVSDDPKMQTLKINASSDQQLEPQSKSPTQRKLEEKTSQAILTNQSQPVQAFQPQIIPENSIALQQKISQQKQQSSSKKIQQLKEPTSQIKGQAKKKDKQTKNVEIPAKTLKKFLKIQSQYETLKKQIESIKQQYNKVAKDLISTQEQSQKKSSQIKELHNELKNLQLKLNLTQNQLESTQTQLKLRQQKVQKLELQYANISKKVKQDQKASQKLTGLQQTVKQLQKMLDGSTKNEQVFLRQAEKYKEMLRIQKQMNSNLKSEINQLRNVSSQHFSLKQEVERLLLELKSLRDAKQQYPIMVQKYQHSEHINEKLKESIRELETKNQQSKSLIEKLEKRLDKLSEQKRFAEKKVASIIAQKQQREGEIQAFKMQLQDQRTEIEVQRKRYTAQIKDLKLALHHEIEKLKITEIQLQQSKKKEKKTVNLDGIKFSSLSKQDLFNLIEELEMKNASIKLNLNALLQDIALKDLKIKDLQGNLMALTRHVVKALPNLDESQGMEYIQKQIIQTGKNIKTDWPEIVQKVLVENLRLKNSVTALGEQFNMRLRTEMEKNNK